MKISSTKFLSFLSLILWLLSSCSEDEKVNEPPVAVIQYADVIDRIRLDGTSSTDAEIKNLTFEWSSSNENIVIEGSNLSNAYFKIPPGTEETSAEVTLKVGDSKHKSEVSVSIPIPPLTQIRSFGLGKNLTQEEDNTVPYAWYLDQANSGTFASINCGPAAVTMAAKWANENFIGSVEDARNTYRPEGGWWYTNDIMDYLNLNNITNWTIPLTNVQVLKDEIDNDHIIILCLDMFYVTYADEPEYRVNKFYETQNPGWGHFIVLKGYKDVDNKIFFEAYDPYSWNNTYQDQTLKGMNRYYLSNNLDMATQIWWDYAIVVSKGSPTGKRNAVDVDRIIHKAGR